jgi:hypothetical protein
MSICLRWREFIAGLGGAAALPLSACKDRDALRRCGMSRFEDRKAELARVLDGCWPLALVVNRVFEEPGRSCSSTRARSLSNKMVEHAIVKTSLSSAFSL